MPRNELIRRLEDLNPLLPESCFVLLWSYFERHGLASAEILARSRGFHPLEIPPYPLKARPLQESLPAAVTELRGLEGEAFDLLALRVLIALDRALQDRRSRRFERVGLRGILRGIEDEIYLLRRRNSFLADSLRPAVTWAADQSRSLAAYTRFHKAIPAEARGDYRLDCRPQTSWGGSSLHHRLEQERKSFRVMLWPLQTLLDYPALEALKRQNPPRFVSLDEVRNEADLQVEVREAIALARELKVTLLVFPELAIPPQTHQEISATLASHGALGHPILTLYGRCHRPSSRENLDLNEAVLLGPDGAEVFRHSKLAAFTFFNDGRTAYCGENLEYGTTVAVLECPLGNLTPLICLDAFHTGVGEVLRFSHANLFLVPSLSPVTSAHRTAAKQLQASNYASTFVCNRWITGPLEAGTSFYQVPRKNGYGSHLPNPKQASHLLFELAPAPAGMDKTSK